MSEETKKIKRAIVGKVVSDKMDKTIVVKVQRTFQDPRVHKVVRVSKKYKVHDENQQAQVGDIVEIFEGRPVSKTKHMYLSQVVTSAKAKG